ncbi:hypothetical protein I0C86_02880 [Plantactinospora sp. S1510]|uniref:Uncharacterized protein n=1 Tax=Plantactinospora alkalitolerans TaxID=2789879 RepID=A0ABS0GP27_9ACTN|nr:hypothetical protein [Plantactinospora alkalitolerans]MBF9127946.1 hypothetical protein [Plantactinospora alkalitolerans]
MPFIAGLLDDPDRTRIRSWLIGRTAQSLTRPQYAESRYRPVDKRIDHWMATYSFNLLLLTLACGAELRASDLFTRTNDPAAMLRNSALQWQAAVPSYMWMDAMEVFGSPAVGATVAVTSFSSTRANGQATCRIRWTPTG